MEDNNSQKNKFKDRGHLFQELAEKGLCKEYVLEEIRNTERERKKQEDDLRKEIKKEQSIILDLRLKSMKRLSSKIEEYTKKTKEELSPYVKDIKNHHNLVEKELRKLGKESISKKMGRKSAA